MSNNNPSRPHEPGKSPVDQIRSGNPTQAAPGSSRSPRPPSVKMPSPPTYSPQAGFRQGSPSFGPSSHTPPEGAGGRLSPSASGAMSPSSNLGQNAFIFPIRSVFQGMSQSDSQQSIAESSASHTALQRQLSNTTSGARSPARGGPGEMRRFSIPDLPVDEDVGIQTIAQMLQGQSESERQPRRIVPGGASVATFTGKTDRGGQSAGGSSGSPSSGQTPRPGTSDNKPPMGFFSAPVAPEPADNPFFFRRTSEGPLQPERAGPTRPDPPHQTSSGTVRSSHHPPSRPQNASAEANGSGLPQANVPPVGQPQTVPSGVNFRDRPGEKRSEDQIFSVSGQQADRSQDIRQPKPQHVGPGGLSGLTGLSSGGSASSASAAREPQTAFELDAEGERNLINDFSGIVHLGGAGSLVSSGATGVGGSGTGTRSSRRERVSGAESGGPSGPSQARMARHAKHAQTRDTVRDFVEEQAHTVNLADPNAPTPSPTPHGDERVTSDSVAAPGDDGSAAAVGPGLGYGPRWAESSETSLSVRDSSEQATASGEDHNTGDNASVRSEEPIVTFRFEHVSTEDGHHVVVGREGKLQRCEDEPITTPGAVQGFGVLMVLEEDFDSGRLTVRQVSENATELLGLSPRYLFRLDCFTRILTDQQEDLLRDNLEYLPDAEGGKGSVEEEGPQVFLLSGYGEPGSDDTMEEDTSSDVAGRRREWTCWVAAHRPKQPQWDAKDDAGRAVEPPNLIVLEFELERDFYNPLMQTFTPSEYAASGNDTPDSTSTTTQGSGSNEVGSGVDSGASLTTVGSTPTPRPGPGPGPLTGSDGSTTEAAHASDSKTVSFGTNPSSKLPRNMRPQGLEGVEVEVPLERIIESTTNHAKPLRALERMRGTGMHSDMGTDSGSGSRGRNRRRPVRKPLGGGTTGTMDIFAVLGQINEQLGSAPDLEAFLKITVGVVQDLCRFHRVLIYQFDESYNGQVVAELVEWGKTTDLFKGLMFPAADIPAQARRLYMINKVRLLYDRSQTTARMVLRDRGDLDHPLDMTHCYLRAMSPIHIKYLANMHVRSSMSVSIMAFGQLWGLIACHSYGHHGMRVSFPVRQMMRILSDSISRNIERLSYAERLHTRKLISTIPTQAHPTGYIVSNADDLLQIFDADAGLLVIGEGCKLLGSNEQGQAMLAIAEYLRIMKFDTLKATNHIQRDFPDLVLPRAQDTIAGLLYVPLTVKAGQDFIVFLRKGQVREVQWAGKPYKDEKSGENASLEPRKSFKTWSEIVTGRSRAWTDDQLESAGVLALIYGKFIQVWREKQSAMASNQLTAILLSNTSHAVRTPLSQIINTLELALSGNIDPDTRSMLENSHQASRALLFHVHDLLDLTRIETGNETAFNDPFDIRQSITDATRLYQTEAHRRGLEFKLNLDDELPPYVIGDSRKIKTVISNLVANAVKFTNEGSIEVYCGIQHARDGASEVTRAGHVPLEIIVSDTGVGIDSQKLEAMFVTLEGAEEARGTAAGLGLGLAVVARIVEQMEGQLRAESEVGVGSRFFFTLQMLASDKASRPPSTNSAAAASRKRTASSGSNSIVSLHSEIDSFVADFGTSHMRGVVSPDDQRLKDAEERMSRPGTFPVTDSSWPVRPTKVDQEGEQTSNSSGEFQSPSIPSSPQIPTSPNPRASIEGMRRRLSYQSPKPKASKTIPAQPAATPTSSASPTTQSSEVNRDKRRPSGDQKLRVLVVEDDTINSQILQKRLRMDKHKVVAVTNGQEAVDLLRNDWDIDCVLMDIQMPIMDGRTAAKEIRKLEATGHKPPSTDPLRVDGRIPIFAVSASLYESDRFNLARDFDGWLLKPLDFSRVRIILAALETPAKRAQEVYVQGNWERGGFLRGAPGTPTDSPSPKPQ